MPGASTGGGSGANGLLCSSESGAFAGSAAGGAVGDCCAGPCAWMRLTAEDKRSAATATRNATLGTRVIGSPLRFFLEHILHNFDFGALGIVGVGGEVEDVGILACACGIEQILDHD